MFLIIGFSRRFFHCQKRVYDEYNINRKMVNTKVEFSTQATLKSFRILTLQ